jgi:hypothetical protein
MRKTFDIATGYSADNMDEAKWLRRIIFLESVAGVPGMVGLFFLCPAGAVGGCGVPPPPQWGVQWWGGGRSPCAKMASRFWNVQSGFWHVQSEC